MTTASALIAPLVVGLSVVGLSLAGLPAAPAGAEQAGPRTLRVGPDRQLATPSAAAAVARDGDTVLIDAGTYRGDVATWTQDHLTLQGVGGRVRLEADGQSAQGKAIWVIAGDDTTVDRIDFSGAEVPDGNGAGIRQEGTGLTVTGSSFHDNQEGLLAGADAESDIVIRGSRFLHNGAGDGQSHNIYVGAVRSLTVSGSYLADAVVGHELKSRALRTTVTGNLITDGDGSASYSIDLPNGGRSLVAGNVIIQGPQTQNPALVSYGAEGLTLDSHLLWVVNNTFVNRLDRGTLVALATGSDAHLHNNLVVGPGDLSAGEAAEESANRRVGLGSFVAPSRDDFHLRKHAAAINQGQRVAQAWRARWEFRAPLGQVRRPTVGRVDLGAFERR